MIFVGVRPPQPEGGKQPFCELITFSDHLLFPHLHTLLELHNLLQSLSQVMEIMRGLLRLLRAGCHLKARFSDVPMAETTWSIPMSCC